MRRYYQRIELDVADLPEPRRTQAFNRLRGFVLTQPNGRWRWYSLARRARLAQRQRDIKGGDATVYAAIHEVRFNRQTERDEFTLFIGKPIDLSTAPSDHPRKLNEWWDCYPA